VRGAGLRRSSGDEPAARAAAWVTSPRTFRFDFCLSAPRRAV